MSARDDAALELDCRGMLCPRPVIELGRRFGEVPVGALVALVTDDPAAAVDVPAWCRMRGQEYQGRETADDDVPVYLVRRVS